MVGFSQEALPSDWGCCLFWHSLSNKRFGGTIAPVCSSVHFVFFYVGSFTPIPSQLPFSRIDALNDGVEGKDLHSMSVKSPLQQRAVFRRVKC